MKIKEVMSKNPAMCDKGASLQEAAKLMVDNDCGMIPVIEENGRTKVIGTITDRDIACRVVAEGKNPRDLRVGDVMSANPICVRQDEDADKAEQLMGRHQVRRLVVVDDKDNCVGVVAQADIARTQSATDAGQVVSEISRESGQTTRR